MALIDAAIGVGVVMVVIYFVYARLVTKYPALKEKMKDFSPLEMFKKKENPISKEENLRKQIWTDNRSMI